MPITTIDTASNILNRVAAEIGVEPVIDPYSTPDATFVQMRYLLNTAGEELAQSYPWELLIREHQISTLDTDTGDYPLPDDFYYMINQTGWERKENVPLFGPLSPQDWQYLLGRDLVSSTIYASFRLQDGQMRLFPQPPPNGLDIHYEYVSKNWVLDQDEDPEVYKDQVTKSTDKVLYDRTLIARYLKLKILESKGFDTTKAQADFNQIYAFLTGHDKGAEVLNAGGRFGVFPYLSTIRNLPDTGYGYP